MARVRYYKPSYSDHESEKAPIWQDEAACQGANPDIFDLVTADSPKAVDLTEDERLSLNKANFAEAEKYCASCPVISECWANADEMARRFTFRGGQRPSAFSGRTRGRPRKLPPQYQNEDLSEWKCPKGHIGRGKRRTDRDGRSSGIRCLECKAIAKRVPEDKRKPKFHPPRITDAELKTRTCKRGHVGDFHRAPSGTVYCRTCRRESMQKRRGKVV